MTALIPRTQNFGRRPQSVLSDAKGRVKEPRPPSEGLSKQRGHRQESPLGGEWKLTGTDPSRRESVRGVTALARMGGAEDVTPPPAPCFPAKKHPNEIRWTAWSV